MALVPDAVWGSSAWNGAATVAAVAVAPDGAVWTVDGDRFATRWHPVYGHALGRIALAGKGAPTNAAMLPDGQHIIVGTAAGSISCHVLATGKARWGKGAVGAPSGGAMPNIASITVSRDGATIATTAAGEAEPSVRLWDASTGGEKKAIPGFAQCVTFFPDGAHALIDGKKVVAITSGLATLEIPGSAGVGAVSHDGLRIVTGDEGGKLTCWEVEKLRAGITEPAWQKVNLDPAGAPAKISEIVIDVPGRILTTSTLRHHVWNLSDGRRIDDMHFLGTWRVAYSPDASRAYGVELQRKRVRQVDFLRHAEVRPTHAHEETVVCMALSPDGKLLATGGREGTVHLRDASTGELYGEIDAHDVRALDFTPDGQELLIATSGTLLHHAVATRERLHFWHSFLHKMRTLLGVVALPDGGAVFWDDSGTSICVDLATKAERWKRERASAKYVARAGDVLLVSVTSCSVEIWDTKTGETRSTSPVPDRQKTQPHVMLSKLRALAIHTGRGLVERDLETGAEVRSFPGSEACDEVLAASPDRRFAITATPAGRLQLWDVRSGRLVSDHDVGPMFDRVTCAAFAPDNRRFFVGTNRGLTMRFAVA